MSLIIASIVKIVVNMRFKMSSVCFVDGSEGEGETYNCLALI